MRFMFVPHVTIYDRKILGKKVLYVTIYDTHVWQKILQLVKTDIGTEVPHVTIYDAHFLDLTLTA